MLSGELSIDVLVCLNCGAIVAPDKLNVGRVKELDLPENIKVAGALFSTFACPECNSVYVGFLAVKKTDVKTPVSPVVAAKKVQNNSVDSVHGDIIRVDENEVDNLLADLTGDSLDKIKADKTNPPTPRKEHNLRKPSGIAATAKCASCDTMVEVGPHYNKDFGVRCDKCLKSLVKR